MRAEQERGQATVELVLVLPVVVGLVLLLLQVALVARGQVLVTHAAREGARAAAVAGPAAAPAAAAAVPGLDRRRLQVSVTGGGAEGELIRVSVRYRMPTDVTLVGAPIGDLTLSATAVMRREHPEGLGLDGGTGRTVGH